MSDLGQLRAVSIIKPYELLPVLARAIVVWQLSDCEVAR